MNNTITKTKKYGKGIYSNIPIDIYHSDLCQKPSISSSGLSKILQNSPLHFFVDSPYSPIEQKNNNVVEKQYFNIGNVAHHLLQFGKMPDWLVESEYADFRSKEAKEWKQAQIDEGKIILKEKEIQEIHEMYGALCKNSFFNELNEFKAERSFLWEKDNYYLKARPDLFCDKRNIIVDYKTCIDAKPRACERQIEKHKYYLQAALARQAYSHFYNRDVDYIYYIFQEKTFPYATSVLCLYQRNCQNDFIDIGNIEIDIAFNKFKISFQNNQWDGYNKIYHPRPSFSLIQSVEEGV